MMGNKWMQGGILYGIGLGLFIGPVLTLVFSPFVSIIVGWCVMAIALWIGGNARGTDGWGGPWNGPKL